MSDNTDSEFTTAPTSTENFDIRYIVKNWPPDLGEDVDNAATFGIVFLVIIGLMFTVCIVTDLDFLRRRCKQMREKRKKKGLETVLGLRKHSHTTQRSNTFDDKKNDLKSDQKSDQSDFSRQSTLISRVKTANTLNGRSMSRNDSDCDLIELGDDFGENEKSNTNHPFNESPPPYTKSTAKESLFKGI